MGPENCKLFFWTQIKYRRKKNKPRVTKKVEQSREYIVPATKIQETKTKNQKLVGKTKEIKMSTGQGKGNRDQKQPKFTLSIISLPARHFFIIRVWGEPAHL